MQYKLITEEKGFDENQPVPPPWSKFVILLFVIYTMPIKDARQENLE